MMNLQNCKQWVKTNQHPAAKLLKKVFLNLRSFEIPATKVLFVPLRILHESICNGMGASLRVFYWTPLFKTRLSGVSRRLYLYGGMPLIQGNLKIDIGNDCRISGQTTFSGRTSSNIQPLLKIGNNVGIGWQTTIAVGSRIIIGDNVRIAGKGFLAGYPGHPIDPESRARGLPETDDQVGDIILEQDVWLGTGVSVMKNVRIGKGTIVAAGSVVTHNLPANVLAAGVPAKIVKSLTTSTTGHVLEAHKEKAA